MADQLYEVVRWAVGNRACCIPRPADVLVSVTARGIEYSFVIDRREAPFPDEDSSVQRVRELVEDRLEMASAQLRELHPALTADDRESPWRTN